jgi:hypothetical protein
MIEIQLLNGQKSFYDSIEYYLIGNDDKKRPNYITTIFIHNTKKLIYSKGNKKVYDNSWRFGTWEYNENESPEKFYIAIFDEGYHYSPYLYENINYTRISVPSLINLLNKDMNNLDIKHVTDNYWQIAENSCFYIKGEYHYNEFKKNGTTTKII